MNLAQFVDENGEHRMRGCSAIGVPAAPVVVWEFDPRTRDMAVIYDGPMQLEQVSALGRKGSSMMMGHA